MPLWKLILFWPWYAGVGFLKALRQEQSLRSALGATLFVLATVMFGVLGGVALSGGVIWLGVLLLAGCWVSVALWIKAMQSMP
ncbi:hypothetical protein LCGC14_1666910 [marine sediment metagenome]|uniref:Uncharacterized protein n=1 Tax=marine sediment metagenome TaxID=412755 RepID=A0A0F9HT29_9ZZZZ